MLDENKRIQWRNEAIRFSYLRYPEMNIGSFVMPHKHKLIFSTFVPSKDKSRLCYAFEVFEFDGPCKFKNIVEAKKSFDRTCKKIKENHIFEGDTSILEPYEVNRI